MMANTSKSSFLLKIILKNIPLKLVNSCRICLFYRDYFCWNVDLLPENWIHQTNYIMTCKESSNKNKMLPLGYF